MYLYHSANEAPATVPELEPFDEEELDDIFAQLEAGDADSENT